MKFKISILGRIYQVKIIKDLSKLENLDGLCDSEKGIILLDARLNKENMLRTFLHEIIHAYQAESGLSEFLSDQAMEMMAQTLSLLFIEILNK